MNEITYLDEVEKESLIAFRENKVAFEAFRKILLEAIYEQGVNKAGIKADPLKNAALSLAFNTLGGRGVIKNEELGEDIRALAVGLNYLEVAFNKVNSLLVKNPEVETEDINIAI